jgi:hypothetical protein
MANQTNKINKVIDLFNKLIAEHGSETLKNIVVGDDFQAQLNAAAGKKQPKKPKKVVDPSAPKKPTTTWRLFCADTRDKLREENPGLKMAEITALQSPMWTALQASTKPEDIKKIEEYKATVAEQKAAYQLAKGDDKPAAPAKPPKNAYQLFMKEERHKYKEEGETFGEVTKKVAAAWKQIKAEDPERAQTYSDRVKNWGSETEPSADEEEVDEGADVSASEGSQSEAEDVVVATPESNKLEEDIDTILGRMVQEEERAEQTPAPKKQRRPRCKSKKAATATATA